MFIVLDLSRTTKSNVKDLALITELIEVGEVVPVIYRRYPLSEVLKLFGIMEKDARATPKSL